MADKIAMYIRLSEEDYDVKKGLADESNSIKSQRMLLKSYINNHNEFNGWDVVEYFDDGTSGTLFRKRDEFQSMIEDAQNGCFNCLIVKDLSRFGRDYLEVGYYTEMLLPMLNIRFISVNDGYDSNNYKGTMGGMEYALKNLMHQLYSMDMSKKTKSAFETRRKAGQCVISILPYGYRRNPDNKSEIFVIESEATVVREIFKMAAEGYKLTEIAKHLNCKGIPSNSKTNGIWTPNLLIKKIRNEFYIGNLIQGRTEVVGFGDSKKTVRKDPSKWSVTKGAVPAIISEELFKAANA
ncbi:MAG: recombinase family protein, partial [Firmicutes bacterium]|nr:recombinase family protein [Bacillota bacterium]